MVYAYTGCKGKKPKTMEKGETDFLSDGGKTQYCAELLKFCYRDVYNICNNNNSIIISMLLGKTVKIISSEIDDQTQFWI